MITMRTQRKLKCTTSKTQLITNLVRNKRKHVKVSKISLQNEKNFAKAEKQLEKLNEEISDSETSQSSCTLHEDAREVSLSSILRAIDELSSEPDEETKAIVNCSMKMALNSDIFWTSPTAILRAIKYSILNRNWDDITHLLLLLLQHKEQYIPVVQCICKFMAKFNPLVKKLGLQQQFELLGIKKREANDLYQRD
ncbi:hypothetical protein WA026_002364 [Henosepilachna vigintioctopunctata]|uniref:Uncharacterized protein n=1 Tax=Henosepilachna vigintioctopunctata TaxID=420089 RepID=A0AAW1U0K8_9CUCU